MCPSLSIRKESRLGKREKRLSLLQTEDILLQTDLSLHGTEIIPKQPDLRLAKADFILHGNEVPLRENDPFSMGCGRFFVA